MESSLKDHPQKGPDPTSASSSYKWWVVFMLWFVCFFNYADRQALSGVAPKLKEEFGFSNDEMGLIGSGAPAGPALGAAWR